MVKRGFVVSDLHLYSKRSRGEAEIQSLRQRLNRLELVVFNGDTFDLAWSDRPSLANVVKDALHLIKELVSSFPKVHFFFLYGNHDCAPELVAGISSLEGQFSNLTSYEQYLRLGKNLFLHGDVCNKNMDQNGLRKLRQSYAEVVPRSRVAQSIYEMIILTGLNRVAYFTHPRRQMISRIYYYLDSISPDFTRGVERIFFGHTHSPFTMRDERGVEFINTGSAIRGLRSNFCEFDVVES